MVSKIRNLLRLDYFRIFIFVVVYILIRSIHFIEFLNFSGDQGEQSLAALNLFRNHELTLIGPAITSFDVYGHTLFYSSLVYYFQMLFLWLGSFSPSTSSYLFLFFSALMILPLYFGVKRLISRDAAMVISGTYTLLPLFIDYSRFLWNPNYQLALSPLLVYSISRIKENKFWMFFTAFWSGILLQFHYMFLIVILGLLIFGITKHKLTYKNIPIYILGFIIGIAPLWISELKNHFYTLQTLQFYLNSSEGSPHLGKSLPVHYFLTILLFGLIAFTCFLKKPLKPSFGIGLAAVLLVVDLFLYLPSPSRGFGMAENWNYKDEEYTNSIIRLAIKDYNLTNFNVTNLSYSTKAWVQKYLLVKDNVNMPWDDYYQNDYLFVIENSDDSYEQDPAYEIAKFKPNQQINMWKINNSHNIYLLKRN